MLAFNEYFWDDWLGVSASSSAVVVVSPTPGRGSGKNHGHKNFLDDYIPMSDDEWDNRAQRIRQDKPNGLFESEPFTKKLQAPQLVLDQEVANQLDALTTEHTSLLQNMPNLASVDELKSAVARLRSIDAEIPLLKKRLYVYTPAKFT